MPYEGYFETAIESLVVVDREGRILEANHATAALFGYDPSELTGQQIEILIPERFRELHVKHRADYMAAPRSRAMGIGLDLAGRRKDGREFPVDVSLTFVHKEEEEFVVCIVTDISERLMREREARKGEMLRTLGSVAAGVAHDLTNPLTVILSRIELMLAESQDLPNQLREDLEVVRRHAQRASRIAQDLLALAQQRPRAYEPVSLNQVAENSLLLVASEMARSGIQVKTALDPQLPTVFADRGALEQVLVNVLINAQEAMPEGGMVEIKTETLAGAPERVRLLVADNGCGIPAEAQPKLFNFLYTTKPAGSGLGLWLCRRIMQEHGGDIEVQSEPGRGATFRLTLPVASEPAASTPIDAGTRKK